MNSAWNQKMSWLMLMVSQCSQTLACQRRKWAIRSRREASWALLSTLHPKSWRESANTVLLAIGGASAFSCTRWSLACRLSTALTGRSSSKTFVTTSLSLKLITTKWHVTCWSAYSSKTQPRGSPIQLRSWGMPSSRKLTGRACWSAHPQRPTSQRFEDHSIWATSRLNKRINRYSHHLIRLKSYQWRRFQARLPGTKPKPKLTCMQLQRSRRTSSVTIFTSLSRRLLTRWLCLWILWRRQIIIRSHSEITHWSDKGNWR